MIRHYIGSSLLYLVVFFLIFSACGSSSKDGDPVPDPPKETVVSFKVMTYNLWASRPGNLTDQNMKDMAETIKRADPDLVALQEVDKLTRRNPRDVTKELAELAGMQYYFFAKAIDHQGGEYGEAILSKLPFKETKAYELSILPQYPNSELRSMARVTVEKEGKEIHFVGTHLCHEYEANRVKQAEDIIRILKEYDKPVILGGDLNSLPQAEPMTTLRTYLAWGCFNNNCPFTFPANNPNRAIDYLMYAPAGAFTVRSYQAYTWDPQASDHLPVLAVFEVK